MAKEGRRDNRGRDDERDSEFVDKLVHINRVAKVVKGGRRFGFAALRAVFETLGMQDVVAKSTGSSNPYNMIRATFDALKHQMHPKDIASQRGMKYSTLQERRGVSAGAEE